MGRLDMGLIISVVFLLARVGVTDATTTMTRVKIVDNTSQLLDKLLHGYDMTLRPDFGGPPTLVDVNLNIRSMGPISESDMAYQMDCYFRQSWVDKRLQFTGSMKTLPVSVKILQKIWKPDTHLLNGRQSYLHTVTTPNKLFRISQDGRILYSMRLTIKASCPMHLESFPMDTQMCPLQVASHGYSDQDIVYIWTLGSDKSIKMAGDMALSQFDLIGYPAGNTTTTKVGGEKHSTLYAYFVLQRHMGYFLINIYIPCSLMVVLSWVSFWINREATADRIALGITTVLTMAFLSIDNRVDLPKVSYSTALDNFVGICFSFVLATILQFAAVHYFTKHGTGEIFFHLPAGERDDEEDEEVEEDEEEEGEKEGDRESEFQQKLRHSTTNIGSIYQSKASYRKTVPETYTNGITKWGRDHKTPNNPSAAQRENFLTKLGSCLLGDVEYRKRRRLSTPEGVNSVSMIDRVSRVIFPLGFLVFHIVYWWSYLGRKQVNSP